MRGWREGGVGERGWRKGWVGEAGVEKDNKARAPDRAGELRRQAPVVAGVGGARVGGGRGGEEPKEGRYGAIWGDMGRYAGDI